MFEGKKVGVVIPAAGSGSRLGGATAKQFLLLENKPVLEWTLQLFQSNSYVDVIAVAGSTEGLEVIREIVHTAQASKVVWIGLGGPHRQDSVWCGLEQLRSMDVQLVMVHDAVRPFVSDKIIEDVLTAANLVGAAIPAIRPKDTVKISEENQLVRETPERGTLWLAQTPQGFSLDILVKAFQNAHRTKFVGTDDASLVERINNPVKIVEGNYDNIKITTRDDLERSITIAERTVKN